MTDAVAGRLDEHDVVDLWRWADHPSRYPGWNQLRAWQLAVPQPDGVLEFWRELPYELAAPLGHHFAPRE